MSTSQQGGNFTSASLYVGDLSTEVNEALLFEIFNAVGPVAYIRVCRDAVTRRSLGYGYVNFHNVVDAERALDTMNFTSIAGRPCRIMWSQRDPSLRKSGVGNIFVKNLDKSIDHKALYDTFSMFGNILSCKVAMNPDGESLGYGFVHYETEEAALKAIEKVDGMVIAGENVLVTRWKPRSERSGDQAKFTNVYVKSLPESITEESLKAMFEPFGPITSVMLATDADGKSKGFGFVNFEIADDALNAVDALNGNEIEGQTLFVSRAQKKAERQKELTLQFERMKLDRHKQFAGANLYIKNLADTIDDEALKEKFSPFGEITSARIMRDENGRSRGFGFVCFSNSEDATKAVTELNGTIVDNKPLYVAIAQRKEVRRAHLEAQYRAKMTQGMGPHMYPAGGPMFYPAPAGGMPQRPGFVYPQQMVPRRWPPQQGAPLMQRGPGPQQAGMVHPGMYAMQPRPQQQSGISPQQNRGVAHRNNRKQPVQGARGGAGSRIGKFAGPAGRPQPPMVQPQMMPMQQQPLTIQVLASAPAEQQKQMIGERLFPLIQTEQPQLAGKITGMLLEMDNGELLNLLESHEALLSKIEEAVQVLEAHQVKSEEAAQAQPDDAAEESSGAPPAEPIVASS
jgi:polyadenylate-binding protein